MTGEGRSQHGSPYSGGEKCQVCADPADHKVEEVDARPDLHPYTAYLCCSHFVGTMGWGARHECIEASAQAATR